MNRIMKALLRSTRWNLVGVAILAALIVFLAYGKRISPVNPGPSTASQPPMQEPPPADPIKQPSATPHADKHASTDQHFSPKSPAPPLTSEPSWTPEQALDILLSPRTTYAQKQSIWKR